MKTITINKKSTLYRLAMVYGSPEPFSQPPRDICQYLRRILFGVCIVFAIIMLGFCLAIFMLYPLAWGFMVLLHGYQPPTSELFILYFIAGIGLIGYMIARVFAYFKNEHVQRYDSVAGTAYRRFRDKTCFMLDFKE